MRNRHIVVLTLCAVAVGLSLIIAVPPGAAVAQQKGKPDAAAAGAQAEKKRAATSAGKKAEAGDADKDERPTKIVKSDSEWMKILSREQFRVTRKKQSERPFTGNMWKNKKDGVYVCVCCGQPLFDSKSKFDAKNGYPCFNALIGEKAITIASDKKRIECSRCDANLGQVVTTGVQPAGAPPAGAPPQPPVGALPPGIGAPPTGALPPGAQPPAIGAPPAAAQLAQQQRYCLNNQSIKFIARDDFEKMRKKSK